MSSCLIARLEPHEGAVACLSTAPSAAASISAVGERISVSFMQSESVRVDIAVAKPVVASLSEICSLGLQLYEPFIVAEGAFLVDDRKKFFVLKKYEK